MCSQEKVCAPAGSSSLPDLRDFADNIHEGVCAIDENGLVIIWNRSAEKLYNVAAMEILGRRLTDFFPEALLDKTRLSRTGQVNVPHHPQGQEDTHILISTAPWYVDGVFRGVVSTDRNYDEVVKLYAALEKAKAKLDFLQGKIKKSSVFSSLIGRDRDYLKSIDRAIQIAPAHANVMITGESGTGKEVFAQGIHELSGREGLFVPVNSSAIPAELFESEFFGYAPGAFTGASRQGKPGFFELADGGTIFLDEISEMPFSAQAKLLRALQEREIRRVGGHESIKVDLRIISASNKNLVEMMRRNEFREDLYYRLNVVEIKLLPLRQWPKDIPLLIRHFVAEMARKNKKPISSVDKEVISLLGRYAWPGNVRELMNVVENMVVTCQDKVIGLEHLPDYLLADPAENGPEAADRPQDLASATQALEKEAIRKALEQCRFNKSKAARLLGIPRASIYNKMRAYGL